jgi:hypothetical protein
MSDGTEAERLLAELQGGRSTTVRRVETRLAELQRSLDEAAAWCAHFVDRGAIGTCLRRAEIAPSTLWRDRWDAVDQVAGQRAANVRMLGLRRAGARGRLMVYFPDADLCDGAAEVESNDFFDAHNAPPWGTWVGYFEDGDADSSYGAYLLAWVPEALIDEADAGIAVNPEECIVWLEGSTVRLRVIEGVLDRHGGG